MNRAPYDIDQVIAIERQRCTLCGHERHQHGREQDFVFCESRRELCLLCPGYCDEHDNSLYPYGKAWHRFRHGGKAL